MDTGSDAATRGGQRDVIGEGSGEDILGLILGMILGPIAETAFYQASIIAKGNYLAAFTGNPIRNILIVCIVASILYPIIKSACKKRKKEK